MKFMMMMHANGKGWKTSGIGTWPPADIQAHIGFMIRFAKEQGVTLPVQACRTQVALYRRPPDFGRRGAVYGDFVQGIYFKPLTQSRRVVLGLRMELGLAHGFEREVASETALAITRPAVVNCAILNSPSHSAAIDVSCASTHSNTRASMRRR